MKIKKNGKVINLTESDLRRIVKKVIKEQYDGNSDYDTASNFAKNIEDWWGGSSDWTNIRKGKYKGYHDFFSKFQFANDADSAAAKSYRDKAMDDLNREVGNDNLYYGQLKNFIYDIVDEIDDNYQDIVSLRLTGDGVSSSYRVDPEIDV
jgi:hypothetical protein